MEISLSVRERILLVSFFPTKGGYEEMQVKRELRNAIQLTVEEMEQLEFQEQFDDELNSSGFKWNSEKDTGLVMTLPVKTINYLKQWATRLDKEGQINDENIELYERILAL